MDFTFYYVLILTVFINWIRSSYLGGELLVTQAVGLAKRMKVSSLVIGLTVISFGTSAPELLVSINASLADHPAIAVGNVIGSNIANITLVLGVAVLILPLVVDRNSKFIDWPMMMLATILFYLFSLNGMVSRFEGVIFFLILVLFTLFVIRNSRRSFMPEETSEDEKVQPSLWRTVFFLILGMLCLAIGADWLLEGAVGIAEKMGMEERVISVTIVAFMTSVPELTTSVIAALKKESDISIGNLIGSNIFNIMAVLGITSIISPIPISNVTIWYDMYWVIACALILAPMFFLGKSFGRLKGLLLLMTYITYITLAL